MNVYAYMYMNKCDFMHICLYKSFFSSGSMTFFWIKKSLLLKTSLPPDKERGYFWVRKKGALAVNPLLICLLFNDKC